MAQSRMGSVGNHFFLEFTNDQGVVTTARVPLGARTEQDWSAAVTGLRNSYPTLRQWATDAATTNTNWPSMTAAQKDAATRETIRRLGVFLDRFGDLLQALNTDA